MRKLYIISAVAACTLVFVGCTNVSGSIQPQKRDSLVLSKERVFTTGFQSTASIDKTYWIEGEEYIEFEGIVTHKKIVLHSLSTDKSIEINVNSILEKGEKVLHFDFLSTGNIVVLTAFTNMLFIIDKFGEVQKEIDLNSLFESYQNPKIRFEIGGVQNPFIFNDTSLIINIVPYLVGQENERMTKYYNSIYQERIPYLFKIDNLFSERLQFDFGLFNFFHLFSDGKDFAFGRHSLSIANQKILIKESFCDTIYIVDPIDLKIIGKHKIASDFFKLPLKVPLVTVKQMENGFDLNQRLKDAPRISQNIAYDENRQLYFFGTYLTGKSFFTVSVYDQFFNKQTELKFDKSEYNAFKCLTMSGKILVTDYNKYRNREDFYELNCISLFDYYEK